MRIRQTAALLPVSVLLFTVFAIAQSQSPSLDIIGIKLGMPMNDALRALKADNPRMKVASASYKYTAFNDPLTLEVDGKDLQSNTDSVIRQATETVQLMFTTPPSQPSVWGISRYYLFPTAQMPSTQTTMDALRKKYGPETIPPDSPIGIQTLTWVFDPQGKLITSGGRQLNTMCQNILGGLISGSGGTAMAENVGIVSPNAPQWPPQCTSIIVLTAQIHLTQVAPNQYATSALTVTLADGGRYMRGLIATRAVISAAAKAHDDKQIERLHQVTAPKL